MRLSRALATLSVMNNAPTFVQFHSAVSTGMETAELYSAQPIPLGRLRMLFSLFLQKEKAQLNKPAPNEEGCQ